MPYQHCPSCRMTVHLDEEDPTGGPCPRCGTVMTDEPRPLFAAPVPGRRFTRTPSTLKPDAVRRLMAGRGRRTTTER